MRCLVALLVSDRNFDVDFINESCKRVAKLTSPIRQHTISTAILNLQNSIFCQPVVTHDRQSIAMRGRLNPPRSHTRSHRNHTSTACMQLLWHFEALVLPENCERPAVIQIDLNYIPRVDELARRAPTLMHSFSTTLLQNTLCFHDCFLPRFSWLGAKFMGSGQKHIACEDQQKG